MNKECLIRLADVLDALPAARSDRLVPGTPELDMSRKVVRLDIRNHRFRMSSWLSFDPDPLSPDRVVGCGTAGCIAGTACVLWPPGDAARWTGDFDHAMEVLGLDRRTANDLFQPSTSKAPELRSITASLAACAVRKLAETGRVDWQY